MMKVESVKLILDACAQATMLESFLPALPVGITPRCVRVIEQIALRSQQDVVVRVSDISEMLDVTRPGITAVLRDLEWRGYVEKKRNPEDGRIVYVSLTEAGWALYRTYVEEYHFHLSQVLGEIGDDGASKLAQTIQRMIQLVREDSKARVSYPANIKKET